MSKVLMILAPVDFQDVEYRETRKALEEGKHQVTTVSTTLEATGKFGMKVKVDTQLSKIVNGDYDGVVFIGGPGSHAYFDDPSAHRIAMAFNNTKRVTAAICAAPVILAKAGILRDKNATSFPDDQAELEEQGAILSNQGVVRDGNIITASSPEVAYDFGLKVSETLSGK